MSKVSENPSDKTALHGYFHTLRCSANPVFHLFHSVCVKEAHRHSAVVPGSLCLMFSLLKTSRPSLLHALNILKHLEATKRREGATNSTEY